MSDAIESTLQEQRVFPPPPEFAAKARVKLREEYDRLHRESLENPEKFWGGLAEELHWFKKWDKVLDWQPPYAKWFAGGKMNASYNCLDHQIAQGGATRRRSFGKASRRAGGPEAVGLSIGSPFGSSRTGLPLRERAQEPWREEGRPRHDLHADGPRSGGRHAGLCAAGRPPLGDLRRVQQPGHRRPRRRRQVGDHHHRRRRLSPRDRSFRSSRTSTTR